MQRLGRNKGGYFGERIEIATVLSDIDELAQARGWISEVFLDWPASPTKTLTPAISRTDQPKLRAYTRRAAGLAKRVYISAGIHGDEPAGPLALRELFDQNAWPEHVEFCIVPCLNPTGFQRGTRENYENVDLNRDYRQGVTEEVKAHIQWLARQAEFDLTLTLHDRLGIEPVFMYMRVESASSLTSLAGVMIDAARFVCPIETAELVDNWDCKDGIIRPNLNPEQRPQWAESIYLIKTGSHQSYTIEAPSDFPLPLRVSALCAAVKAALKLFGGKD